jgi:hypothetical protein
MSTTAKKTPIEATQRVFQGLASMTSVCEAESAGRATSAVKAVDVRCAATPPAYPLLGELIIGRTFENCH